MQRTAYEMRISAWSSDVFSSDLWVVRRIGYVIGSRCSASSQAVRFGSTADSVASWPGGALVSQAGNPAVSVKPADCAARWRPQIRAFGRQEQARCGRGSLVQSPHNNSFKPNALRYTKHMADTACHVFGSTTHVGLTQALGLMRKLISTAALTFSCLCSASPVTSLHADPISEERRVGKEWVRTCRTG